MKHTITMTLTAAMLVAVSLWSCNKQGTVSKIRQTQATGQVFKIYDGKGIPLTTEDLEKKDLEYVVALFTDSKCAESHGGSLNLLKKLASQLVSESAAIVGIYAAGHDTMHELLSHANDNDLPYRVYKDLAGETAQSFGITSSPSVLVYRRGMGWGKGELDVSLPNTIKEIVRLVQNSPSCVLQTQEQYQVDPRTLSYQQDIAPIIQKKCERCHRENGGAPFALSTLEDVLSYRDTVIHYVSLQIMPPWSADLRFGDFVADAMSPGERHALLAWLEWTRTAPPDAQATAASQGPQPERPSESWTWKIGEPDRIITMPEAFKIPERGTIDYQFFEFKSGIDKDTYIESCEVKPGAVEAVHHVTVFALPEGKSLRDKVTGEQFAFCDYALGNTNVRFPPGTAFKLAANSTIVFEVHYTTNGTAMEDQSTLGLKFFRGEPQHEVRANLIGSYDIEIPPGEPHYRNINAPFQFARDGHIVSLRPHMHVRGKSFKITALYEGERTVLLSVPFWNFNWQRRYMLPEPLAIRAGTMLEVEALFDNSALNPDNPNPKEVVKFGRQTWEEMKFGHMHYYFD